MSEKIPLAVTPEQLDAALEERQTPDRRKRQEGLPQGVNQDRRQGDRREKSS